MAKPSRRVHTACWLAAMLLSAAAQAAPSAWRCDGERALRGEFTPRGGQLHFDGQDWPLTRVREAREARYVNARAGLTLTLKRSDAVLTRRGEPPLNCRLVVKSLAPAYAGPDRAASASAR
jgi:hypothetical protein